MIVHDQSLKNLIKTHEGLRLKPYRDTVGKLTIGYGRNLDDKGISMEEADYLLTNDIAQVLNELRDAFPWYLDLSQNRQFALCDMCFNLGLSRLRGFRKMLNALALKEWDRAAQEALKSKWAEQVGHRAHYIANLIRTG